MKRNKTLFRKYFRKKKSKRQRMIDKRNESNKTKKETNEVTHGRNTQSPKKILLFPQQDEQIKQDWDKQFSSLELIENNFETPEEENLYDLNINMNQD